tara:strand:+ start:1891 stop:2472 length:582 start_codon:yes stop_codon:yes gene_type:complete
MLTDTQLWDLSKRMNFPLEAIVFKDKLAKIEMNKSYIINLQDHEDERGNKNSGTHWTCFQINKSPNGKVEGIYFDPYGVGMPKDVEEAIKKSIGKSIPHTTKDIQSLMNNACGWFCCAFLHWINCKTYSTGELYLDTSNFLDMFDDLEKSVDFKKNEYMLKHFFRSADEKKRMPVSVDMTTIVEKTGECENNI